jgi:hypothetical protein
MKRILKMPNNDTVSSLLDRKDYVVKKIKKLESEKKLFPERKAVLCAEIDAITAALDFIRFVLNQIPEEQLCKIIARNDEIHGVPPTPPESVVSRIDRAKNVLRKE